VGGGIDRNNRPQHTHTGSINSARKTYSNKLRTRREPMESSFRIRPVAGTER